MTDKELIKNEIERLKAKQLAIFSKGESEESCGDALTHIGAYNQLLSFIDSLPEEPASEELEEAASKYCEGSSFEDAVMEKPAYIAGAKWQKEQFNR